MFGLNRVSGQGGVDGLEWLVGIGREGRPLRTIYTRGTGCTFERNDYDPYELFYIEDLHQ